MPLKGSGSGISAMSRIRATVSALKSERARRMKLLAEIRALFSLSGSVAFLRMKSMRHSSIFSLVSVASLIPSTRTSPVCSRSLMSDAVDVADDLAERLRVTLKRLGRKEAPCGHGFDVFADRDVRFLDAVRVALPPAKGFIPAEGAELEIELKGRSAGLFLVRGLEPGCGGVRWLTG